jgi:hypothetical protein
MSFEAWLEKVDAAVERRCGMSLADLPDVDLWALYAGGSTPSEAAAYAHATPTGVGTILRRRSGTTCLKAMTTSGGGLQTTSRP